MHAGPASVLVVDDEIDTCRNMEDILTEMGYRVAIASDGPAALELIRKTHFDIALLDLKMPGMDGLTLYRAIKKLRAGTVAVIVTGYAGNDVTAAALLEGAVGVLPKPVDFGHLMGVIGQALDQPLALVVDDDEALCRNLWDLLRDRGLRCCLAHSTAEARERLGGRDYSVVLIDMKLPDGDGRHVFQLVKEKNPQARAIGITGFRAESESLVEQLVADGVDAVYYKPFDVPALLNTIQRLASRDRGPETAGC